MRVLFCVLRPTARDYPRTEPSAGCNDYECVRGAQSDLQLGTRPASVERPTPRSGLLVTAYRPSICFRCVLASMEGGSLFCSTEFLQGVRDVGARLSAHHDLRAAEARHLDSS